MGVGVCVCVCVCWSLSEPMGRVTSGDYVAASHVPDSSRQEGHDHSGEERVLHAAGRE